MARSERRALVGVLGLLLGAGCTCAPIDVEAQRYACARDEECRAGFRCVDGVCARPGVVDAGEDVDAGQSVDAGADDAGQVEPDAGPGLDAGPAVTALVFSSAPTLVEASACSALFVVETVDAMDAGVTVTEALTIELAEDAGLHFFTSASCQGAETSALTLFPGQGSAFFTVSGTTLGPHTIVARAEGLTPASTTLSLVAAPDSLAFVSPITFQRAGQCDGFTVQSQAQGQAAPVSQQTHLDLLASPAFGTFFFSDAECQTPITGVELAAGSAQVAFFVKTVSGGANVITASGALGQASTTISTAPVVRRGQCNQGAGSTLPDGGLTGTAWTCSFGPSVSNTSRSLLFLQVTGPGTSELAALEARCRFSASNQLLCQRVGVNGTTRIHYQVVELPDLFVQHGTQACSSGSTTFTSSVDATESFVLKTFSNSTGSLDDDDTAWAQLTGSKTVTLGSLTTDRCSAAELQLAHLPGLHVTRGVLDAGTLPAGVSSALIGGLPDAGADSWVVVQPSTASVTGLPACTLGVTAAPAGPTAFRLERSGDAGCVDTGIDQLVWERLAFGARARVDHYTVTLDAGVLAVGLPITGVDPSRSIAVTSTMMASGQAGGRTNAEGVNAAGEFNVMTGLDGGGWLSVERGSASAETTVEISVIEWNP